MRVKQALHNNRSPYFKPTTEPAVGKQQLLHCFQPFRHSQALPPATPTLYVQYVHQDTKAQQCADIHRAVQCRQSCCCMFVQCLQLSELQQAADRQTAVLSPPFPLVARAGEGCLQSTQVLSLQLVC
jgi:hypothetical protein